MREKFSIGSALILSGMLLFAGYGWAQMKSGSDAGTSSDASKSKGSAKKSGSDMGSSGSSMDMSKDSQKSGAARGGGSENVKKVQAALKEKGQDPGPIDGVMGPKTKAAIKAYQSANNIKPTGRLDSETAKSLGMGSASSSGGGASGTTSSKSSSSATGSDKSGSSSFSDLPSGRNAPSSRDTGRGSSGTGTSNTGSGTSGSSSFGDLPSGRNAPSSRDPSTK